MFPLSIPSRTRTVSSVDIDTDSDRASPSCVASVDARTASGCEIGSKQATVASPVAVTVHVCAPAASGFAW